MPTITLPYNLTLRPYQVPAWNAFIVNKVTRGLVIWPRRNGKDIVFLNIAIAKMLERVGLYLYVAPYYGQIRNIIWDGATDSGRRFLDYIPPQLIKRKREDRMMIELKNGSILKLAGSDNPDSLVGGNPVGIVFTEFSLHKPEGWNYLRPILANNGGWALFNGCLKAGTPVYTRGGVKKIEDLTTRDEVSTGRSGWSMVRGTHNNGYADTMTVKTSSGYEITATPNHKLTIQKGRSSGYEWKRLDELKIGDRVVLSRTNIPTGRKFDVDAYLLGCMMGDGSIYKNVLTLSFSKEEKIKSILPALAPKYPFKTNGRHHKLCSKEVYDWYVSTVGNKTAREKEVPDCMRYASYEEIASFMAGWLDTDGTVKAGQLKLCTTSSEAAAQAQSMMLSLGVRAKKRFTETRYSELTLPKDGIEPGISYEIECYGEDVKRLLGTCPTQRLRYEKKGKRQGRTFSGVSPQYNPRHRVLEARQEDLSYRAILESDRSTYSEVDWACSGFFVDEVKAIDFNEPELTYDIILDSPHSYIAEGFRTHNTPRGLNHFYTMKEMAEKNPDWFFQHLSRDDTGYPSIEAIEEDRKSGMPESLIQQEYYTSFLSSSESTLIPLEIIQPCLTTRLEEKDYNFEPRLIGVDPAYSAKGDMATIAKRQGRMLHPLRKFKGLMPDDLANKVVEDIKEFRPHAVMVDSGRGEGVISRLCKMGYEDIVIPVNFGGGAYNSNLYLNKRAEIWCKMRDWFLTGQRNGNWPLIPNDPKLITGLSTPMMLYNEQRGKIQIESKKEIRGRGEYVMDEPDAVAVTFAEDIRGDNVMDTKYGRLRAELEMLDDDYNPEDGYDPLNFHNAKENVL